jgi:hypothetical protein
VLFRPQEQGRPQEKKRPRLESKGFMWSS